MRWRRRAASRSSSSPRPGSDPATGSLAAACTDDAARASAILRSFAARGAPCDFHRSFRTALAALFGAPVLARRGERGRAAGQDPGARLLPDDARRLRDHRAQRRHRSTCIRASSSPTPRPRRSRGLLQRSFEAAAVPTSVNAYLVNTGDKLVLIDAGAAKLFGPTLGNLLANLAAAGYKPEQVDAVLHHAHARRPRRRPGRRRQDRLS